MGGTRAFLAFASIAELSSRAAEFILATALRETASKGFFSLALSGGRTPQGTFALLSDAVRFPIDWARVHVFWVDERAVPPESSDSNFGSARDALFAKVRIPEANIHRVRGELPPEEAAGLCGRDMKDFFLSRSMTDGTFPVFDLAIMGMGPDGHTASLFPYSLALHETRKWVVAVPPPSTATPKVPRVTMTYPVINRAKNLLFLTSGEDKRALAAAVAEEREKDFEKYPAAGVRCDGELLWLHADKN